MTALCVRSLSVDYPTPHSAYRALDNVGFTLERGQRLAVVGESGSGKSTLALAIASLLPPGAARRGEVDWRGTGKPPRPGHDAGFVFQNANSSFDPLVTIGRQLVEVRRTLKREAEAPAIRAALHLLEKAGFDQPQQVFAAYPHQLSGGQAQRAGIACALAGDPPLLLADEPTSALDTIVQAEIIRLINDLARDADLSLILITHDLAVAYAMSDRVAVMRDGRLIDIGAFTQVFTAPTDPYVRRLRDSFADPANLARERTP